MAEPLMDHVSGVDPVYEPVTEGRYLVVLGILVGAGREVPGGWRWALAHCELSQMRNK
jgi:hypothetical protein